MTDKPHRIVKVGGTTTPHSLAHSLRKLLEENADVVLHAVGHGAVGQAIKGCVVLNTLTVNKGTIYMIMPSLIDLPDEKTGKEITITRFRLIAQEMGG